MNIKEYLEDCGLTQKDLIRMFIYDNFNGFGMSFKEKIILIMRVNYTLKKIAIFLNITPERVRQIEHKGVRKLIRHKSREIMLKYQEDNA